MFRHGNYRLQKVAQSLPPLLGTLVPSSGRGVRSLTRSSSKAITRSTSSGDRVAAFNVAQTVEVIFETGIPGRHARLNGVCCRCPDRARLSQNHVGNVVQHQVAQEESGGLDAVDHLPHFFFVPWPRRAAWRIPYHREAYGISWGRFSVATNSTPICFRAPAACTKKSLDNSS